MTEIINDSSSSEHRHVKSREANAKSVIKNLLSDSHCHVDLLAPASLIMSRSITTHGVDDQEASDVASDGEDEENGGEETLTVICATSEGDWGVIDDLLTSQRTSNQETGDDKIPRISRNMPRKRRRIIGGFGIHPWWAQTVTSESTWDRLRSLLVKHPSAIVAEIGIDTLHYNPPRQSSISSSPKNHSTSKCCENADVSSPVSPLDPHLSTEKQQQQQQRDVFVRQLAIAAEFRRPVSVHVVGKGSYGIVSDVLLSIAEHNKKILVRRFDEKEAFEAASVGEKLQKTHSDTSPGKLIPTPPSIIFHGFTGSLDFIKRVANAFTLSSKQRAMCERKGEVTQPDNGEKMQLLPFPAPAFYVGIGSRTTFTTKSFSQLVGKGVFDSVAFTQPPSLPALHEMNSKEINQLKCLPASCLLLETDSFYHAHSQKEESSPVSLFVVTPSVETMEAFDGISNVLLEMLLLGRSACEEKRGMVIRENPNLSCAFPAQTKDLSFNRQEFRQGIFNANRNLKNALRAVL